MGLFGCAGSATVPAPIAEIPSSVNLPGSVAIDTGTIALDSDSSLKSLSKFQVMPGGPLSDEISVGHTYTQSISGFVDALLAKLTQINIPVGNTVTTLQVDNLDINGDSSPDQVKLDFANYDYGEVLPPCSGHTAALPICYRIWVNGTRTLAGRLEEVFPTRTQKGSGRFKFGDRAVEILGVGVIYDQANPVDRSIEYFLLNDSSNPAAPPTFFDNLHVEILQLGPDPSAKKTLRLSSLANPGNTEPRGLFRYVGRWLENKDFWAGSIDDRRGVFTSFTDQCARISSGAPVGSANCGELGISVKGVPFPPLAPPGSAGLPSDFPATPTF